MPGPEDSSTGRGEVGGEGLRLCSRSHNRMVLLGGGGMKLLGVSLHPPRHTLNLTAHGDRLFHTQERSLALPHHTPGSQREERTQMHTRAREMQGSNVHIHTAFP